MDTFRCLSVSESIQFLAVSTESNRPSTPANHHHSLEDSLQNSFIPLSHQLPSLAAHYYLIPVRWTFRRRCTGRPGMMADDNLQITRVRSSKWLQLVHWHHLRWCRARPLNLSLESLIVRCWMFISCQETNINSLGYVVKYKWVSNISATGGGGVRTCSVSSPAIVTQERQEGEDMGWGVLRPQEGWGLMIIIFIRMKRNINNNNNSLMTMRRRWGRTIFRGVANRRNSIYLSWWIIIFCDKSGSNWLMRNTKEKCSCVQTEIFMWINCSATYLKREKLIGLLTL